LCDSLRAKEERGSRRGPEVSGGGTDRLAGGGGGDLAIVDRIDTTRNCERIRR
jgi:hypothetical protein